MGYATEGVLNTPNREPANLISTISALSTCALDHKPHLLPPARRLLHACFLGLQLDMLHFQDAVMKIVCLSFVPDVPLSPASITEVH